MPHFCVWHLPSLFSFSRSLYPCSTNDTGKSRCPHIQSVAEPARAASGQWQEKFSDRQFHCFVVFLFVSLYCAQYYIILSKKVVISSRARAYIKFFTLATVATLQHFLKISMLRVTTRWQGWQRMTFLPIDSFNTEVLRHRVFIISPCLRISVFTKIQHVGCKDIPIQYSTLWNKLFHPMEQTGRCRLQREKVRASKVV